MIDQHSRSGGQPVVVRDHHSTLARSHELPGMEAEAGCIAMAADRLALIATAYSTRRVLDENQFSLPRQLGDSIDIGRHPELMNRHECSGPRRDGRLESLGSDVERVQLDV